MVRAVDAAEVVDAAVEVAVMGDEEEEAEEDEVGGFRSGISLITERAL